MPLTNYIKESLGWINSKRHGGSYKLHLGNLEKGIGDIASVVAKSRQIDQGKIDNALQKLLASKQADCNHPCQEITKVDGMDHCWNCGLEAEKI